MEPISLRFDLRGLIEQNAWEPFRDGIDVIRLHGDIGKAGSTALLRYQPGATLPPHSHCGFEHILTLEGVQQDERGTYHEGSLVMNFPGSHHSVASPKGCTVLVIWSADVLFE
jgi:anti-sigma factor ChrR (cupin superfamily)